MEPGPQGGNVPLPGPPGTVTMQPGYGPPTMQMAPMGQQQYGMMPQGQMVTQQPGGMLPPGGGMVTGQTAVWMPMPPPIEGVPPGLEYLTMVDTIMIHQIYEMLELISSFETKNRYALRNTNGEQVFYAVEESGCCERQCCGPQRGFTMHILDNFKREVMLLRRPFKCCAGGCGGIFVCCTGCAQECTIEAPPGNVIGTVQQRCDCCASSFYIRDAEGNDIFKIDGPCCCMMIGCQDKEFPVTTIGGQTVGAITKKWGGCFREAFTDADVFSVNFPMDLEVKMKAILLGATFLIDFMEFEQQQNKNNN